MYAKLQLYHRNSDGLKTDYKLVNSLAYSINQMQAFARLNILVKWIRTEWIYKNMCTKLQRFN